VLTQQHLATQKERAVRLGEMSSQEKNKNSAFLRNLAGESCQIGTSERSEKQEKLMILVLNLKIVMVESCELE